MTPSLYANGKYVLTTPFVADPSKSYVCMAIRSFEDIYEQGDDVFTKFYEAAGLDAAAFEADRALKANIITLMSETAPVIYVPDTYIESYPNMANIIYSHMVISVSLGALPDTLNLDLLKQQITNLVSDVTGVTNSIVNEHKVPSTGFVTPEQHAINEAGRVAAITLRTSDYAKYMEAQVIIQSQNQQIAALSQVIIDNGLIIN